MAGDIALHGLAGAAVGVIAWWVTFFSPLAGALLLAGNALFWFRREQEQRKAEGQSPDEIWTRGQVALAWGVPALAALVADLLLQINVE